MTKHKKKKGKGSIMGDFTPAMSFAGASVGMSIIGGKLQPHLPVGTPNPLTSGGASIAKMTPLMVTVGGSSMAVKQVKALIKNMKKLKA